MSEITQLHFVSWVYIYIKSSTERLTSGNPTVQSSAACANQLRQLKASMLVVRLMFLMFIHSTESSVHLHFTQKSCSSGAHRPTASARQGFALWTAS